MTFDEERFTPEEQAQAERLEQEIAERLRALPFLPPGQRAASDTLLIEALARFYQPEGDEIQDRLRRARARVEERRAQSLAHQRRTVTPLPRMKSARERQAQMKVPWSLWRGVFQRSSLLASAVGLFFVVVLVGSLVVGVLLTRHSITAGHPQPSATANSTLVPTATPNLVPTPTPTSTPSVPAMINTIHMLDATTGWAVTNYNHVLRTTDGANHWQDVTPPTIDPPEGSVDMLRGFLSPSVAWIASTVPNGLTGSAFYQGVTKIFLTADGGQHWTRSVMQGYLPVQVVFTDGQHGWLLNDHGDASSAGRSADVFRTSDGNATWTKVASSGPSTGNRAGVLPYGAGKWGIGALDASTAWVAGSLYNSSAPGVYVTHDGGATWRPQALGLPAGAPSDLGAITGPPVFFNSQDGILPAYFASTANSPLMYVYVTHDGGANWKSTSIVGAEYAEGAGMDFLNTSQGWVSFRSSLFVTSDGGQHWTELPQSSALSQLAGLSFVSSALGWAVDLSDAGARLFKTMDGGRTWTVVPFAQG